VAALEFARFRYFRASHMLGSRSASAIGPAERGRTGLRDRVHAVTGETGSGKAILPRAVPAWPRPGRQTISGMAPCHRCEARCSSPTGRKLDSSRHPARPALRATTGLLILKRSLPRASSARFPSTCQHGDPGVAAELGNTGSSFHGPGEPRRLLRKFPARAASISSENEGGARPIP